MEVASGGRREVGGVWPRRAAHIVPVGVRGGARWRVRGSVPVAETHVLVVMVMVVMVVVVRVLTLVVVEALSSLVLQVRPEDIRVPRVQVRGRVDLQVVDNR